MGNAIENRENISPTHAASSGADGNTSSINNRAILEVNALEYRRGTPSRVFAITVPAVLGPQRRVRMPVDDRLVTVEIPRAAATGQRIHVRVPAIGAQPQQQQYTQNQCVIAQPSGVVVLQVISPEEAALLDEDVPPPSYFRESDIGGVGVGGMRGEEEESDEGDPNDAIDGFLECRQCTYHNRITRTRCKVCGADLLGSTEMS